MNTVWRWLRGKSMLLYGGSIAALYLLAEDRFFPAGSLGWAIVAGVCLAGGLAADIRENRDRKTAYRNKPPPDSGVWCQRTPRQLLALADRKLTNLEQERRISPNIGTWVYVEGKVSDVSTHRDNIRVVIDLPSLGPPGLAIIGGGAVFANFDKSKYRHLEALQIKDRIRLIGKFEEITGMEFVSLEDCELMTY